MEVLMTNNCCALILSIVGNKTRNQALREMGIRIPIENRNYMKSYRKIPNEDREKVYKLYYEEMLSTVEIAKIYNSSDIAVLNYFKRVGITTRNKSEARRLMLKKKEVQNERSY